MQDDSRVHIYGLLHYTKPDGKGRTLMSYPEGLDQDKKPLRTVDYNMEHFMSRLWNADCISEELLSCHLLIKGIRLT